MEMVSVAANLIVSEWVCIDAHEADDDAEALFFRTLLDAQRDALRGQFRMVLDRNDQNMYRLPTDEELATASACRPHPDNNALARLLS